MSFAITFQSFFVEKGTVLERLLSNCVYQVGSVEQERRNFAILNRLCLVGQDNAVRVICVPKRVIGIAQCWTLRYHHLRDKVLFEMFF